MMAAEKKDNSGIKTVTIREGYIDDERGIGIIETLPKDNINVRKPLPLTNARMKGGTQCNCCPYGYHIDLDFVTYCEKLYNGTYHQNLKRLHKNQCRRQKSPEINLGIHRNIPTKPQHGDPSLFKSSNTSSCKEGNSSQLPFYLKQKPSEHMPLKIGISIDTNDGFLSNIHLSPRNNTQNQNSLLSTSPHTHGGSNTSLSSTSTECSTNFHLTSTPSKCTCGSQQIADTIATLNEASVINSGLPPGYVGINTNILSTIRSQVATSLNRMKELEEQAKAVPILQVKLSVLKEEKRLLLLQLKNKIQALKERSVNIDENNVKVDDSYNSANSFPRFRKRTLSGTSLERRGIHSSVGVLSSSLDEPFDKANFVDLKDFHSYQRDHRYIKKSTNENVDLPIKEIRNVGTSCTVLTRDVGVGHIAERLRSVGTGDEKIMSTSNTCVKCSGSYIKNGIPLDSVSSSEFAGSESDGENIKTLKFRSLSNKFNFKIKTEDKSTCTDIVFSRKPKLSCKKCEQVSLSPTIPYCVKCEEKSAIKHKSISIEAKLIPHLKSFGINTDSAVLKNTGMCTDPYTNLTCAAINTDKTFMYTVGTATELSAIDIDAMQLLQQRHKQMKDKGTGVPRPLIANIKVQTTPNTKDASVTTSIEKQTVGIQVNIPQKNDEDTEIKGKSQTLPIYSKKSYPFEIKKTDNSVQVDSGASVVDASCGNCSIHDTFCNRCELRQMETIGIGNDRINDILCDRCQSVKHRDVAVGEEKPPVVNSVGVNTIEILNLVNNSGIHVCDKCDAKIKSVAKDLVDKNIDNVLHSAFANNLVLPSTNVDSSVTTCTLKTEHVTKKEMNVNSSIKSTIAGKEKLQIKQETLTKITKNKESHWDASSNEATDNSDSANSESPDDISYDGILNKILNRHKKGHLIKQTEALSFQTIETGPRRKAELSKEMIAACKMLNTHLLKPEKEVDLAPSMEVIQKEWFHISSEKNSNPHAVEDYLDTFEEMSKHLFHKIVNLTDANGNTAMHYAVSHGNFDVVSVLLDSKVCDANIQNKAGYTSVMLISLAEIKNEEHKHVVHRLFQINDINLKAAQNGQTALMLAASQGRIDAVKLLLECGAEINMQDNDGSTALMCAAEHGHLHVVSHLLTHPECDPSLTDNDGSNALSIAMEADHKDIALKIYAVVNFSRGSSPYSSLRTRRNRASTSSRSSLPTKGSTDTPPHTPPPQSPRPRKNSSSF